MARAKRARRYGPGESLPGKVPLPRAEDEGGTCGGRVGGWSGEVEGGGRVMARHRARRSVGLAEVIYAQRGASCPAERAVRAGPACAASSFVRKPVGAVVPSVAAVALYVFHPQAAALRRVRLAPRLAGFGH